MIGRVASDREYRLRGIQVCERWRNFWAFVEDMGLKPTPAHTLDRRNNDGDYEPNNCRWATRSEQQFNRRASTKRKITYLTVNGETQDLVKWAKDKGINKQTIRFRLRRGWSELEAVDTPLWQERKTTRVSRGKR